MSGAHRIQKPPSRFRLTLLLVPARFVWHAARAAYGTVADWRRQAGAWWQDRWDNRDPFVVESSATSPDPIPADEPVVESAAAPARPVRLTPNDAAAYLHAEHHPLPWQVLEWRISDDVHGQVRSLDCDPNQMREVVEQYAVALGATLREDQADEGRTVLTATGEFAGVLFIVSAVFISADTVPLRVYAEAEKDESLDDTLTTQAIPQRVLEEVLGK